MADRKEAIHVLQNLIDVLRDGQTGYQKAAEHIKDPSLKSFLNETSLERAKLAGELENEMHRLGEPEHRSEEGDMKGRIHRGWLDVKQALGGGDKSVMEWLESGEDTAKKAYKDALDNKELPTDLRDTIQRQASRVIADHDKVRDLRDQLKAA